MLCEFHKKFKSVNGLYNINWSLHFWKTSLPSQKKILETSFLFPYEYIFCQSKQKKIKGKVIHKLINFASYKGKTAPWESIETKALELGDDHLYRQVQGQNLFAVKAWYHKECFSKFRLDHSNHIKSKEKKEKKSMTQTRLAWQLLTKKHLMQ